MSYSVVFFGSRFRKFLFASLLTVRIAAGVIVTVAFQEIDDAPHAKASAQRNNEGGKGAYRRSEKCHIVTSI